MSKIHYSLIGKTLNWQTKSPAATVWTILLKNFPSVNRPLTETCFLDDIKKKSNTIKRPLLEFIGEDYVILSLSRKSSYPGYFSLCVLELRCLKKPKNISWAG